MSRHCRRMIDQTHNNPTNRPSTMPTTWVTIAAATALAAAMTRNGRGGNSRSMHSAHMVRITSAAISSWSFWNSPSALPYSTLIR